MIDLAAKILQLTDIISPITPPTILTGEEYEQAKTLFYQMRAFRRKVLNDSEATSASVSNCTKSMQRPSNSKENPEDQTSIIEALSRKLREIFHLNTFRPNQREAMKQFRIADVYITNMIKIWLQSILFKGIYIDEVTLLNLLTINFSFISLGKWNSNCCRFKEGQNQYFVVSKI